MAKRTTRNNKVSVFTGYFSDKKKLIELFNAIEGAHYSFDTKVEINTLKNVLYQGRYNDISFTLDNKFIVLIEAQSSINENMPLRLLLYIARIYEKIVDSKDIYKKALVKLPKPEFIVIYNGAEKYPERCTLKLTDAFGDVKTKELLELTVSVYNVNSGYNTELLKHCKPLSDYSLFFARIRDNQSCGMDFDDAVSESIGYCIDNGIMAEYLETHSSEVRNMLFVEYNQKDAEQVRYEEGFEAGEKRGEKRGEIKTAHNLLKLGVPAETVQKATGLTAAEIRKLQQETRALR
jgi:hypothetical protein